MRRNYVRKPTGAILQKLHTLVKLKKVILYKINFYLSMYMFCVVLKGTHCFSFSVFTVPIHKKPVDVFFPMNET